MVNPNPKPAHGQRFTLIEHEPFKRFFVDTIGPRDGDGLYKYIIVFIDGMSRYVRLFPVATLDGENFAKVLDVFLCQVPVVQSILFDNHGQFNNTAANAVLTKHGLDPQEDSDTSTP